MAQTPMTMTMETIEAYRDSDRIEASISGVDYRRIRVTPQDPLLDKDFLRDLADLADDTDEGVFEEEEREEEQAMADAAIQAAEEAAAQAAKKWSLEAVQEKLLEIVQESCEDPIHPDDDINEALDSLSTTLMLNKVTEAFGVQIPIAQAYDFPTVALLARHIEGVIPKTTTAPAVRAPPRPVKKHVPKPKKKKAGGAHPWLELQNFWIPEEGDMPAKLPETHEDPRGDEALRKAIFGAAGGLLLIEPGTSVEVFGLNARPDLNGRVGSVLRFDFELMRWEVQIEGEQDPKLLREDNVRAIGPTLPEAADDDATEDDFGLMLVRAGKGSAVYVAHSLGADALDLGAVALPATASSAFVDCPVYMLVFDKIAAECASVQSLAELYANRIVCHERWRRFDGAAGGTVMVAGSSSGCTIAYEVAGRLRGQAGALGTELVLFDDGLSMGAPAEAKDGAPAPPVPPDAEGPTWLGGEVEAALLVARLLGAPEDWALRQRRKLQGLAPGERDAEVQDLQMHTFWEYGSKSGISFGTFRKLMAVAGDKVDRLESLATSYKPTSGSKLDVRVRMVMTVGAGKTAAAAGGL